MTQLGKVCSLWACGVCDICPQTPQTATENVGIANVGFDKTYQLLDSTSCGMNLVCSIGITVRSHDNGHANGVWN